MTERQTLPQGKNEGAFLADQTADAKIAMVRTLHDMKETLSRIADMRSWVKRYPWLATGAAVTVGFVTGTVMTPPTSEKTKKRKSHSEAKRQPSCQDQEAPRSKTSVLFTTAGKFLAGILLTVIQGSIAASIAGKEQPQSETPSSF